MPQPAVLWLFIIIIALAIIDSSNAMAIVEPASSALGVCLLTASDQETIWKCLKYAAHETTDVRNMALLQPYGQDFGQWPGDIGVGAVHKNNNSEGEMLGAAWIRDLAAAAARHNNNNNNGSGLCTHGEGLPELAMAVFPTEQGKGIGTLLLRHLLEHVQRQGIYPGICLSCRTNNLPAMRLYQKVGFVAVPNSEHPNRAGGTSVDMVCYFDKTTNTC